MASNSSAAASPQPPTPSSRVNLVQLEAVRLAVRVMLISAIKLQNATAENPLAFHRLNDFAHEVGNRLIHQSAMLSREIGELERRIRRPELSSAAEAAAWGTTPESGGVN